MATVKFTCEHCNQVIEADESMIGQTAECPTCKHIIVIEENTNHSTEKQSLPSGKNDTMPNIPSQMIHLNFPSWCKIAVIGILLANILLILISIWPKTWEYKAVKVRGDITKYDYKMEKFFPVELSDDDLSSKMNLFYRKWDLVGTVTETETVHPNFGKEDYVTGIQPNTRSKGTILIFRRQKLF